MAALPDQDTPGDSPAIDPTPYVQAYDSGYSYQDVADHHDAVGLPTPPRADLSDIWAGSSAMDAGWSQPIQLPDPGVGKGSDPVNDTLRISDEDAANVVGGVGAIEKVGLDVAGTIAAKVARISQLASENTVGGSMESGTFFRRLLAEGDDTGGAGVRGLVRPATEAPIGTPSALSRGEQLIQDTSQSVIDALGSTTAKVVGGAAAGEAVLMGGLPGERKKKAKANE